MRLLLTPILYLGLLCPASVLATPIHATPSSTEVDSTGKIVTRAPSGVPGEGPVTEYSVRAKLRHIRPERNHPHVITKQAAGWLRNGIEIVLPWYLPVLDAHKENRPLDPKTVPDICSSFRVTQLSYEGSFTHIPEMFKPRPVPEDGIIPGIEPPSSNDGLTDVNHDVYWLDVTVLKPNGSLHARLVICLFDPELFQQDQLTYKEVLDFALNSKAGYGNGHVKERLALGLFKVGPTDFVAP
ncbi:hypothetical protein EV361DRAFT_1036692 [Lentinula raphanica]|nr:hypothetical protein EV361DRAFT_1036692 [Lentinula raphanica]